MSYATVTPRDLLELDLDPSRIRVERIQVRFGIGRRQAYELRQLACQSPVALAYRQAQRERQAGSTGNQATPQRRAW